jgi:CspA family cold shock protein
VEQSTGTVKFFNSKKGFGFISPDGGGKDIFFHANNVVGDPHALHEGQKVSFEEGSGRKGPEALNVTAI